MSKVVNISEKQKIPKPHSKRKAQEIINSLSEDSNNVHYTKHAKERMVRGFTYNDILTILREGIVREEPRYNEQKRLWSYRVDFLKFDGNKDAGCAVAIQQKGRLCVITVMWID